MKQVYMVQCNRDMTEGRGPIRVVGLFESEADAKKLQTRPEYHPMGVVPSSHPEYSVPIKAVPVFESLEDFELNKPEAIRERALAKLSAVEKEALGLK